MNTNPPDLRDLDREGFIVAFSPTSHWVSGKFDPEALIFALKAQPGLEDFTDALGNSQSAVRLDAGDGGFWISIPAEVDAAAVTAAVAAYAPPAQLEQATPLAERVADALRPIAAQPAGTPVTAGQLVAVINALTS